MIVSTGWIETFLLLLLISLYLSAELTKVSSLVENCNIRGLKLDEILNPCGTFDFAFPSIQVEPIIFKRGGSLE